MEKQNSFKDVIMNLFYDDIINHLSVFIEDNIDNLECNSNYVEEPDEAELVEIEVITTHNTDSKDSEILFDVIISASIDIAETVKRNRETDEANQWFRLSCKAQLEDGLHNFNILDIEIDNMKKKNTANRLSDALVPIIKKDEFDTVAEEFLKEYYPDALREPMPIPTYEIAEHMGLEIKEVHLTKHFSMFGQIYFGDSTTGYYDRKTKIYKSLQVKKGTILLDPDAYFMRNIGCVNNTIIHECVHWYKHRKYHELEKLYNDDAKLISCRVIENTKQKNEWTSEDWMEWHANGIAPRILMPKNRHK